MVLNSFYICLVSSGYLLTETLGLGRMKQLRSLIRDQKEN